MEPRHLLRKGALDLRVGSFAAGDATDVRRIDAGLDRDTVVNPAIFRDQMRNVLGAIASSVTISVRAIGRSHSNWIVAVIPPDTRANLRHASCSS